MTYPVTLTRREWRLVTALEAAAQEEEKLWRAAGDPDDKSPSPEAESLKKAIDVVVRLARRRIAAKRGLSIDDPVLDVICARQLLQETQDEFAAELGVSRVTVARWESCARRPDSENLTAIAKRLARRRRATS